MWRWQPDSATPHVFQPGTARPWGEESRRGGTLLLPVIEAQGSRVIGRLYLRSEELDHTIDRLIPAAQSLAGQIASALFSAEVYQQTLAERLARERAEQELALGAQVQASFLPGETPHVEGWEIVAALESARDTSGDFYDFIRFEDGRIGIVIADVTDKGLGAAFYMALSRTLLRTYAVDHALRFPSSYPRRLPAVLAATNRRIMQDTNSDMFVTLFYGIVDPASGVLTYANAGHNPPYLFRGKAGETVTALTRTGLPVGVLEGARWGQRRAHIHPGDMLVLYTDGLTEVEDAAEAPFGEERVQRVALDHLGRPAQDVRDAMLAAAHRFAGDAPRFDDITLMIVRRRLEPA
jgi:sigma-B regulation protein RsbU (phosphoserine phosphatase)